MLTIGLTGGIATGKSTVAEILRKEHGQAVLDADQVAREVVQPGQPAYEAILEGFGPSVFGVDGTLDRTSLRNLIARDAEARKRLEAITHPRILTAILQRLSALAADECPIAFVEAALLVETGSYAAYDELWVVTCTPGLQLQRLMERDACSKEDAQALIQTQLPLATKEALADRVLRNTGTQDELRAQVAVALRSANG